MVSGEKQGRPGRYRKKSRRRTISQGEGKMETTGPGAGPEEEEEEAGKGKGKGKGKAEQEVKVSFVAIDTQNYHPKKKMKTLHSIITQLLPPPPLPPIRCRTLTQKDHSIAMATMTSIMATGTVVHLRRMCGCRY